MAKIKIQFDQTNPFERQRLIGNLRERLDINESIASLIQTMHEYEAQFGISTVEFYAQYLAGKMGDGRDVMRWAGSFDDYQTLLREHFQQQAA